MPRKKDAPFILGREAFEKICAVEGIKQTAEMKARFEEFDRLGLSHAERRRRLIEIYSKETSEEAHVELCQEP